MKNLYAFYLLCLIGLMSCEKEHIQQTCAVDRPTEEIKWLRERVQDLKATTYCQVVRQGKIDGHSVFIIGACEPNVISINAVYDCEGNLLCYNGDETCPNFDKEVKDLQVIWQNGK